MKKSKIICIFSICSSLYIFYVFDEIDKVQYTN